MNRFCAGRAFELDVTARVRRVPGWKCGPYDRRAIPDGLRTLVHAFDKRVRGHSGLRHAPDLVAVNPHRDAVVFLDPKTGRMDTPNWVIEKSSLFALVDWETVAFPVPVLIVWPDMTVAYPNFVRDRVREGITANITPCWLTPKSAYTQRLDTYLLDFPPLIGVPA